MDLCDATLLGIYVSFHILKIIHWSKYYLDILYIFFWNVFYHHFLKIVGKLVKKVSILLCITLLECYNIFIVKSFFRHDNLDFIYLFSKNNSLVVLCVSSPPPYDSNQSWRFPWYSRFWYGRNWFFRWDYLLESSPSWGTYVSAFFIYHLDIYSTQVLFICISS